MIVGNKETRSQNYLVINYVKEMVVFIMSKKSAGG